MLMLFAFSAMAQINYGKRTWTFPATNHEAVTEVPAEIFTDFATAYSGTVLTNEKVGVFVTDVRVATEGDVTAAFVYNGGNIRMDISGVDLVNASGEVVYSDYHFGYSGGNKVDNVYTLTGVAVGDYTMRMFIPAQKEDVTSATTNDSRGVLTITGAWMYPNEGVYYNIKNVRSNKYVTFKGEGKQFTQESANNGAGSYWHFVEASLDDVKKWNNPWLEDGAIPEGVKPYWVYSAACEKGVENVSGGNMASPDMSEQWPAKIYYIGVHTKEGKTGLIFRPCHEDGSSWNDQAGGGTAVGHWYSDDAGSLWSVELANVADNDLIAMGTAAKTEALTAANAYKTAYYIYAKPSVVDAAVAEIEGADVSTVAKALTFVIKGTGSAIVNEIAESATVLTPKAGDRFMIKGNVQQNDYLIAATEGNVKTTNGIGANNINALDLVWTLKAAEGDGKFYLYNERLGVYVAPLATNTNGVMGYATEVANAGVYSVEHKGANVAFHADTQDGYGYIHHPRWGSKEVTRWEANDANSQWILVQAPIELTTNVEAPVCYAIKSGRDGNYYFTLENNKIKLVDNQNIVGNDNAKWFFMLDADKNLKIYPYADKNNSMGYITVEAGNSKLTNDHAATGFVADTYTLYYNPNNAANNNGKCFAFRPTEGNTFVSNHGGTLNYMGFYGEHNDKGTRIGFENINKAVLASKIEAWDPYLANEGDKVCQYVIEDDVKSVLTNAETVAYSNTSNNSDYATEIATLDATAFPAINVPTAGFYRVKSMNANDANKKGKYWQSKQDATGMELAAEKDDARSIIYLGEDNSVTSYGCGYALNQYAGMDVAGTVGKAWTITDNAAVPATYALFRNGDGYCLSDWTGSATYGQNDANAAWAIEEVTVLPVKVSAAGYATFYAPVALTLPAELTAYTVTVNGGWATLNEIEDDVIPAETGVVLEGAEGTYNLTVGGDAEEIEGNSLLGSVAASYVTADAYVLGYVGEGGNNEVGFYTATKNQQGGDSWLNNGFKAYLPKTGLAATLRFNFGGTTAIESVLNNGLDTNAAIYDLSGRRVEKAVKGIYIQNGKKIIVK